MSFICFDTEDNSKELMEAGKDPFKKKVTQIAAITREGKKYYNRGDVKDFLRWLKQQPERYIYAHNIQYDLGNLFSSELDVLDTTLVGGRVIRATWGTKYFLDSFNIWPMAAAKLAPAFGLEKLETKSMATDKEYVFRDVEIIHKAMEFAWQFCELLGVKHLAPTLGGLCVKIWKHWGGTNCHDSLPMSRAALFGGRVELFKRANDCPQVCYTDINSLYPSVMRGKFPGVLENWDSKLAPYGVAKCTVTQPETELAILPFRDDEGRILYPWGKFTGTWTIPELQAFESNGGKIQKVHQCYGTTESMEPYGEFVDKLYKVRLESQSDAEKLFFKLLMNNLYGRLGTTGVIGRTVWQTDKNKFDGVPFGEKVLVEYQMPLSEETNWSHAAYVAAYGRLELFKHLKLIGAKRLIYCDTDSTIFDAPGQRIPFPVGSALGQMKLESWESIARTYAPKMYQAGNTYKAKGVPKRLAKTFIQTGKAQFDLPFKFREAIAFFDRKNTKRLSVWRTVEKHMKTVYDKKICKGNRFFPCKILAVE